MLAGYTGLVGDLALRILIEDSRVEKILLIGRSKVNKVSSAKIIQIVSNLDDLKNIDLNSFGIKHLDAAICALGTTIKKAGSKQSFKKVDHDYVVQFAEFAKNNGAQFFSVVSALGADKMSGVFYNQVKGEMEESLRQLHFQNLTILRPSLLLGERTEKRVAESIAIKLSPFLNKTLIGPLKKYRGVEAHKVAKHLAEAAFSKDRGLIIIENLQMVNI